MSRFPYMSDPVDVYFEQTGELALEEHADSRAAVEDHLAAGWQASGRSSRYPATSRNQESRGLDGRVFNRVVPKILDDFLRKRSKMAIEMNGSTPGLCRALATSERQRSNALARGSGSKDFKHLGPAMALPIKNKRIISTSSTHFACARSKGAFGGSQVARARPADFSHAPPILSPTLRAKLGLGEPPPMAAELPPAAAAE